MREKIKLYTILFSKNLIDIGDIIGVKGEVLVAKGWRNWLTLLLY